MVRGMVMKNRIEKLEALVEQRKTDGSHNPENARALLIEEGIYGADGKITPEYGGEMNKPDDVPPEMVETFLSNLDSIEPFRRENSTMSPQEYRRYRILEALRPILRAERKRCADTIASYPEWVAHSDEVAAETGMLGRQTTRADIVAAVLNPKF